MSADIQPAKSLQERVSDRIREQIGELLTDDDLKKLTEAAVKQAFFAPRVLMRDYGREELQPPLIISTVENLLQPAVNAEVAAYLKTHGDEIKKHIDDAVGRGIVTLIQQWLDQRLYGAMVTLGDNIKQQIGLR